MLRITGQALVVSLLRYGYSVAGSGMGEHCLRKWDTCITNVLARRILGVGPSARLPILRAAAGLMAAHNMYAQHCGDLINQALRASGSTIEERLSKWMCTTYGIASWQTETKELALSDDEGPHIGRLRFLAYDVPTTWLFQVLPNIPELPSKFLVQSVFHTNAHEIEAKSNLKDLTYTFAGTNSWLEVGVQILTAAGWRPDCTHCSEINLDKVLPPQEGEAKLFLVTQDWGESPEPGDICRMGFDKWGNNEGIGMQIIVSAFFQSGCGTSVAWVQHPPEPPSVQVWALGMDMCSDTPPDFVPEGSFLHALLLAERALEGCRRMPDYVLIQAGTWRLHRRLRKWLEHGTLALFSDAAAEIVKVRPDAP